MEEEKPCIILDLDQTLISGEPIEEYNRKKHGPREKFFRCDNMEGYYYIYSRPYLQEFLDYIFKHFRVSVWTAASKDYALFIIEKIILNKKPNRKLDFILFSYHCDWSKKYKKSSKNLKMLWEIFKMPGYSQNNTFILDDYVQDVHKPQPKNCIIAKPFEFTKKGSENDNFLKNLITQLETLRLQIKDGRMDVEDVNIQMKDIAG